MSAVEHRLALEINNRLVHGANESLHRDSQLALKMAAAGVSYRNDRSARQNIAALQHCSVWRKMKPYLSQDWTFMDVDE